MIYMNQPRNIFGGGTFMYILPPCFPCKDSGKRTSRIGFQGSPESDLWKSKLGREMGDPRLQSLGTACYLASHRRQIINVLLAFYRLKVWGTRSFGAQPFNLPPPNSHRFATLLLTGI